MDRRQLLKRVGGVGLGALATVGLITANEYVSSEDSERHETQNQDQQRSALLQNYNPVDDASTTVGDCRGKFTHSTITYIHDTDSSRFITEDTLRIIPGINIDECSSNSGVWEGRLTQKWSAGYDSVTVESSDSQQNKHITNTSRENDATWEFDLSNSPHATVTHTCWSQARFDRPVEPGDRVLKSGAAVTFTVPSDTQRKNTNDLLFETDHTHSEG